MDWDNRGVDPEKKFELEGEEPALAKPVPPTPPPRPTTPRAAPVPSGAGGARNSQDPFEVEADTVRRVSAQTMRTPPKTASTRAREAEASETGFFSHFEPRFKRRLKRIVPMLAIAFLVAGWFFVGVGLWAFLLAGAAVGVFSAYRRSDELVLGAVAAVAGYGATALAIQGFPLGIGVVILVAIFGGLGALAAIDDRLGEDSSKLLAAGREKDPKKPDPP